MRILLKFIPSLWPMPIIVEYKQREKKKSKQKKNWMSAIIFWKRWLQFHLYWFLWLHRTNDLIAWNCNLQIHRYIKRQLKQKKTKKTERKIRILNREHKANVQKTTEKLWIENIRFIWKTPKCRKCSLSFQKNTFLFFSLQKSLAAISSLSICFVKKRMKNMHQIYNAIGIIKRSNLKLKSFSNEIELRYNLFFICSSSQ